MTGNLRKKFAAMFLLALAMTALLAGAAYADRVVATGNGMTAYYDDGSRTEYNARGSAVIFYDEYGNELARLDDIQFSQDEAEQFLRVSGGNAIGGSSNGSSGKYSSAELNDAYWTYNNGHCVAHWEADYQSHGKYTVTLYYNGRKQSTKTTKGGKSQDFTAAIAKVNRTGEYIFEVKGNWSGHTDSISSDDLYVDESMLSAIRSRSSSSGSSSSGSAGPGGSASAAGPGVIYTAAGPGASPATQAGPANPGWQNLGGSWKYLRPNGDYAVNCWEMINGKWYYFFDNGIMAANQWVQTDAWYYVGKDGDMQVNQWIQSQTNPGIWYYVGGDGRMVTNTVINGWPINASGECFFNG